MSMPKMPRFSPSPSTVCRGCRRQLRLPHQIHSFSSIGARQKTIPAFTPTTNDELDTILLTFRHKYFQPHALSKHHRDLIYKPKHHQLLLNDPGVTVTMSDGEEIRLMPTNPIEKPRKDKSLRKLMELLGRSEDATQWSNLRPLMEGFKMSREPFPQGWLEQIVRKAHEKHQTGVIIQCARQAKDTGFSLSNGPVTRELFIGLHRMAAAAGFTGQQLERASKWVEQTVLLMEDELHCAGKLNTGQTDMRQDILVMATYVELNAARALESDQDASPKIVDLVKRLLMLWKAAPPQSMDRAEHEMERDVILLHSMQVASKVGTVAQSDMASELGSRIQQLERNVQDEKAKVAAASNGKPRRCLQMYEAAFGN